jgi:tetratricopeptide (TPR) repeat protein
MVAVSLRSYLRSIDDLVKHGLSDEAIAHCQHILSEWQSNLAALSLLAAAYLERQDYLAAMDVLNRVLAIVPDDFTAQVGMSVIHEEQGRLSEAIRYMEDAFILQPANPAIREELNRLYTQRDGVPPTEILLPRAALARMYIKGGLTPQAIAELRAAIQLEPDRLDLKIWLATQLATSGSATEAAQICQEVLTRLPDCLECNRILDEIAMRSSEEGERNPYRKRLLEIDPYYQYVSSGSLEVQDIPDGLVKIEQLDQFESVSVEPADLMTEDPRYDQSYDGLLTPENTNLDEAAGFLAPESSQSTQDIDDWNAFSDDST